MKEEILSLAEWEKIRNDDGTITRYEDDIPIHLINNPKLKKRVLCVATSGSSNQPNPGFDVFRRDDKDFPNVINKDHYIVQELKDCIKVTGPIRDSEHHLQDLPKRIKEAKMGEIKNER